MKYFCKQVNPEVQEDDLFSNGSFFEYFGNSCFITGNDSMPSFCSDKFDGICECVSEWRREAEDLAKICEFDIDEFIYDIDLRKDRSLEWSAEDKKRLIAALTGDDYNFEDDYVCKVLDVLFGGDWTWNIILDNEYDKWNILYYNKEIISKEVVSYIECCYFNCGEEYRIIYEKDDFNPNGYNCGYTAYIRGTDRKKELAEYIGCSEDDVVVGTITDYEYRVNYSWN